MKKRLLSILLVIVMCASMTVGVFAETVPEEETGGNVLITVNMAATADDSEEASAEETPYWTEETENEDGTTETVTHYVTDSEGNPVDIGAEPPKLDAENLEAGHMDAQKFGAFENEEDAENGIVKLTFDVVGKPVEADAPIDLLIIGDESGSMNMYGKTDTAGANTSYMPCLNEDHYYGVQNLQKSLYESEQAKLKNAIGALNKELVAEMSDAMAEGAEKSVEDILTEKTTASEAAAAALAEAQAAYDAAATEEEKAALEETLNQAKADSEAAAAALSAANSAVNLLQKQAENNAKLNACKEGMAYINPHDGGLENIVFKQWDDDEENWDNLLAMVRAAGMDVPEDLDGSDVFKLLFKTATDTPDKNHYHYNAETGAYEEIPYVENDKIVDEEGKRFSYWSPDYNNAAGCVDRMMLEKLAAAGLAIEVLENPNSSVGYIGFTKYAYPSLGSGGFMNAEQIDALLEIIQKTEGHDYTNYIHALWTAKDYIENRTDKENPVYIVFMSDGVPSKSATGVGSSWNVLEPPVAQKSDGDYVGYNEIVYGETNYSNDLMIAEKVAEELKKWYKDTYGKEMDLFTVGINTNDSANNMLSSMASDEEHFLFCKDPKDLTDEILEFVDTNHVYPSGTLTDKIGEDFELFVDADHPFTVSGLEYDITAIEEVLNNAGSKLGNVVSFQVSVPEGATRATIKDVVSITWEVNEVDENGDRISYYVQLKSEELEKTTPGTRIYDTNADTAAEAGANLVYYALSTNEEGNEVFVAAEPTTVELRTPHVVITNVVTSPETEVITPVIPENTPVEELDDPEVPLEELPEEDVPLTEILDEEVPLANVPMTGDSSLLFIGMSILSGTGLAGLALTKKREDEE